MEGPRPFTKDDETDTYKIVEFPIAPVSVYVAITKRYCSPYGDLYPLDAIIIIIKAIKNQLAVFMT